MKKLLFAASLLFVSLSGHAGPWDLNIQQYDQFGTGLINRLTPIPSGGGVNGLVVFDGSVDRPKVATYDGTLVMSGLVLGVNPSTLAGKFNTPIGNTAQYIRGDGTLATYITDNATLSNGAGYRTQSQVRSDISLTTTGSGAATYNPGTGVLNVPTPPAGGTVTSVGISSTTLTVSGSPVTTSGSVTVNLPTETINDSPGRSLVTSTSATGFQISSTKNATACYEGSFSTTSTIGGPSSGTVVFETAATNSTTPGDWTIRARQTYSNNITLAIVLNQVQGNNWTICRRVQAGLFVRLRSSTTGTASVAIDTQQESY